ncbi:shikimate dehydrogenase [Streptomyces sp. NPDC005722]
MTFPARLIAVVSSGTRPSLTSALCAREAARQGQQMLCVGLTLNPHHAGSEDVGDLLKAARPLGFAGLDITGPFQELVTENLDELAPEARSLGAANIVVFQDGRTIGHNTEVTGFAKSFACGLSEVPARRVVQLGTGRAGAAAAHALLTLGTGQLTVVDSDPARAIVFTRKLNQEFGNARATAAHLDDLPGAVAHADGMVNAVPLGACSEVVLRPGVLHSGLWVTEAAHHPQGTDLLQAAAAAGCRTLRGGHTAVFQASDSLRLLTGLEARTDRLLADVDFLLGDRTEGRAATDASVPM